MPYAPTSGILNTTVRHPHNPITQQKREKKEELAGLLDTDCVVKANGRFVVAEQRKGRGPFLCGGRSMGECGGESRDKKKYDMAKNSRVGYGKVQWFR